MDRFTTEIIASEMHMLDSRSAGSSGVEQQQATKEVSEPATSTETETNTDTSSNGGSDDDIPF